MVGELAITPFVFPKLVRENDLASVTCVAQSTKPVTFIWKKNDDILIESKPRLEIVTKSRMSALVIDRITPQDTANYTCLVNNGNILRSHTAELVVSYSPKWIKEPEDLILREIKSQFEIVCQATASPPARISWKINGVNCEFLKGTSLFNLNYILFSSTFIAPKPRANIL